MIECYENGGVLGVYAQDIKIGTITYSERMGQYLFNPYNTVFMTVKTMEKIIDLIKRLEAEDDGAKHRFQHLRSDALRTYMKLEDDGAKHFVKRLREMEF